MSRKWTKEQRQAIEARDGSVMVSAAAGSGKTTVLVERVIQRIVDEKKPCPANGMLIVTFTKAAAGEMRDRIAKALEEKISEDPANSYLREQQMLLPDAQICTIDSFCGSLVRENFHMLDISSDFQTIDDGKRDILISQAIDTVMERNYASEDPDFLRLVETLINGRDDSETADCIIRLYTFSTAYPFPEDWLDDVVRAYEVPEKLTESFWGRPVTEHIISVLKYCLGLNEEMRELSKEDDTFFEKYTDLCASDREMLMKAMNCLTGGSWDEAYEVLSRPFCKVPVIRGRTDEPISLKLKGKRGIIKNAVEKQILKYMCVTEEENAEDLECLRPLVKKLVECTKEFSEEFFRLKKGSNAYDFSDISQMALGLLVKKTENGYERTDFAGELSLRYEEILIDEYQDTNKQQDMFFEALSRDKSNLFRVGDVKQSIYSFRQAMPDIFINIRAGLEKYKDGNYPAKIILDKNFRSRNEVTSYINYIFSQIMSKSVCKIDYDEQEILVPRAEYAETPGKKAHLHIVDTSQKNDEKISSTQQQAKYVAGLVRDILESGRLIQDKNGLRPVTKKDICILLRSVKDTATAYADELRRLGIDCFTEVRGNFFSATEIAVMLSLLRVIDNPVQDIPLLSVLHSPIFSFTVDEVACLRIANRRDNLYSCLLAAEETDPKVADFLLFFRKMRYIASTSTASDLIRRIYEETLYPAICSAMNDGERRRANLMLLVDYAVVYEKSGYIGVSGFIRFIDKLFKNKKELDASNPVSENADVVRIMTVHKSKGLEFPVCILSGADKKFNDTDEKKGMVISSDLGIGLLRRDTETMTEYETLPHTAAKLMKSKELKAEEMRVLYVALTRAKEELYIIGGMKNPEKAIKNLGSDVDLSADRIDPMAVSLCNNYLSWIVKAAMKHPDCPTLRKLADADGIGFAEKSFDLDFCIIDELRDDAAVETAVDNAGYVSDAELMKLIESRVGYEYKYNSLRGIPTKKAASHMREECFDRESFAISKPAFMESESGLTAARIGTATHKVMQFADFDRAYENLDDEIARLVEAAVLTQREAEAVNRGGLTAFFECELVERIKKSPMVFREKKFTVDIPVSHAFPDITEDFGERIMVQGVIDCAFLEDGKLVIVDYKTDRVHDSRRLAEMYKDQIDMYRYALESITEYSVSKAYLYSFHLSELIEIS